MNQHNSERWSNDKTDIIIDSKSSIKQTGELSVVLTLFLLTADTMLSPHCSWPTLMSSKVLRWSNFLFRQHRYRWLHHQPTVPLSSVLLWTPTHTHTHTPPHPQFFSHPGGLASSLPQPNSNPPKKMSGCISCIVRGINCSESNITQKWKYLFSKSATSFMCS